MNAAVEFVRHTKGREVLCAQISLYEIWDQDLKDRRYEATYNLKIGYSPEDYEEFLKELDTHDYDHGYGSQQLFGYIWYKDMTWSARWEYDGSEGWEYHRCPEIPFELWRNTKQKEETNG